ncbi:MAG TPA: MBL fold metallo-hydrolase [Acidimicrobiales bacterium]|nr:MBL fold metallo-hydrolase [Acidimicrobiales bacterium]
MTDSSDVDEVADGIYRISSWLPGAAGGRGLTVNQFLVLADEPLLFHTGLRSSFPATLAAVARLVPLDRLRWLSFGHVEADECGAMNDFLAAAPRLEVAAGALACRVSVDDLADRPPRRLVPGEPLDLGGRRVVAVPTPHAPHNQEAVVLYEETTATLLCGDLFTQLGRGPAVTRAYLVEQALEAEDVLGAAAPGDAVPRALDHLAGLAPRTLATMHGSSFEGDARVILRDLASAWRSRAAGADCLGTPAVPPAGPLGLPAG